MSEIGSKFSTRSLTLGVNRYIKLCDFPMRFVLSGRTGLHLIAEELKNRVYGIALPDYCCGSMIAPFVDSGFKVCFYNSMSLDSAVIDAKAQVVLIMDYFGFLSDKTLKFAGQCKNDGKIIIVDATQTAFSNSKAYNIADYIVVSYRKWFDSLCAVVYSKNGFSGNENKTEHKVYNAVWRNAARLKEQYLKAYSGDKKEFLSLYNNAEQILEEDYKGYAANCAEIAIMRNANSDFIRGRRRKNAGYLINEIKKLSDDYDIKLVFEHLNEEDCPLFVPILLNEKQRHKIRTELIKNDIYCPIHWPINEQYPYSETVFHKREMSLICDQRYDIEEMKKQIFVLKTALPDFAE